MVVVAEEGDEVAELGAAAREAVEEKHSREVGGASFDVVDVEGTQAAWGDGEVVVAWDVWG